MARSRLAWLPLACALGCSGNDETEQAIEAPAGCGDPLALMLPDGTCIRPGVPADGCAEGFAHDGEYGCDPILPEQPCAHGLMAVPGESGCRAVLPCGAGRWGDIPIDASTIYVDASYTGLDSDGSETRPWTTVSAAVVAAPPGALVAIAAGTYNESVVIMGKPVRLFGVCPEKVTIAGFLESCPSSVCVFNGASDTHLRGFAASGAIAGISVTGAERVLVEAVWTHDTGLFGLDVEDSYGPTSVTIRDALVERAHVVGFLVGGGEVTLERSVLRATLPNDPGMVNGRGLSIQRGSRVTMRSSVVEQNHEIGVFVTGSEVNVEASVIRNTQPQLVDQNYGWGVSIGVICDANFCDPTTAARVTMRGSLVEQSHDAAIVVAGSQLTLEHTVLRTTWPRAVDHMDGSGLFVTSPCSGSPSGPVCDNALRANATVRASLIEQHHNVGLEVHGSDATVESTVVRATSPQLVDLTSGRGISIQVPCQMAGDEIVCDALAPASLTLRESLVGQSHESGVFVAGSQATVERSILRSTAAQGADGFFGDGITVFSLIAPATATIRDSGIDESARAGIANFGGSVSLAGSRIRCAEFAIAGERFEMLDFALWDGGDNLCGCPDADSPCKVLSADLHPPPPLGSVP